MKNIRYVTMGINILAALAVIGATQIWAPTCQTGLELANGNMVPMRCFYTSKIAVLLSVLVIVFSVGALIAKKWYTLPIAVTALALIGITFDYMMGIGLCKSTMQCHTTGVWIRVSGLVILASTIAGYFVGKKKLQDN